MAVFTAVAAGIGAAAAIGSTVSGISSANKQRRSAQRDKDRAQREIDSLKKSRQSVVNPYAGVVDLSSMAKDLSGQMSNPFASLGVATSAAEMQIEEADIALANTLDTLRATGAGAGGATALAQAASRAKTGIAAGLEKQEAMNNRLRAQGQQRMQQIRMGEAARIQGAEAKGAQFMFGAREGRQMQQLDRVSAQAAGYEKQAAAYGNQARSMMGSALGSAAGLVGAGLFGGEGSFGANFDKNFNLWVIEIHNK